MTSNMALVNQFRLREETFRFPFRIRPYSISTIILPVIFLLGAIFQPWVEVKWMFLDPLTAAQLSGDCCHTYYGFISTLGIIMWTFGAGICIFGTALLYLNGATFKKIVFPFTAALLTGWLLFDDAFLFHEVVAPSLGIPQNAVLFAYCVLALIYSAFSWRAILESDVIMFLLAGSLLATSMFVDVVFHSLDPRLVLLEDSTKFLGIFCWTVFHIVAIGELLQKDLAERDQPQAWRRRYV